MDARELTLEISVLSLIARKLSLETSTVTRQLESSLWKLQRSLWCLYCFLSGLECSLSSLNAPMVLLASRSEQIPRRGLPAAPGGGSIASGQLRRKRMMIRHIHADTSIRSR